MDCLTWSFPFSPGLTKNLMEKYKVNKVNIVMNIIMTQSQLLPGPAPCVNPIVAFGCCRSQTGQAKLNCASPIKISNIQYCFFISSLFNYELELRIHRSSLIIHHFSEVNFKNSIIFFTSSSVTASASLPQLVRS